jgi:hypothetical protein
MITINLDKAKVVAHKMRRAAREKEFAPLDAVLMKQIPGTNTSEIEAARQAVRDKYATVQVQMEQAQTVDELKALIPE